jgi:hypothetical protein
MAYSSWVPVFSTLSIFLTQATTSWELGLEGLSKLMTPYLTWSSIGLANGEFPHGMGVKFEHLTLSFSKFYVNMYFEEEWPGRGI